MLVKKQKETKAQRRDRILQQLRALKDSGDEERAHSEADGLLLELIDDEEVKKAFGEVPKWYA